MFRWKSLNFKQIMDFQSGTPQFHKFQQCEEDGEGGAKLIAPTNLIFSELCMICRRAQPNETRDIRPDRLNFLLKVISLLLVNHPPFYVKRHPSPELYKARSCQVRYTIHSGLRSSWTMEEGKPFGKPFSVE